jgi:alkylation response protein AidB-like acyl-CoA dehydrogenase
MVSGAGSGGVDRIGGASAGRVIELARARSAAGRPGGWDDPVVRQRLIALWSEETIRRWTNLRVRAAAAANRPLGAASSIGKVIQGRLNQELQACAVDLLAQDALAWEHTPPHEAGDAPARYAAALPFEVEGMLRSRANTIEGGTTEVNKNILAERVLGLPREPDPWQRSPWNEVPRSG